MSNKTKRIILICIAAVYCVAGKSVLIKYHTAFSEGKMAITLTTFQVLTSAPFLIMIWIMVGLIDEPKYHKLKVALKIYAIIATILIICAFLFGQ